MSAKPPVNGTLNADGVPRCSTHRKRLKFFCSKHELLLCSVCAVKRHRGCDEVLTVAEACEDKKAEGKRVLDVYSQRIGLIENAMVERKAAKKLLDTNAQEIQNEVHDVTQKLIDLVKHEERTLIQTLQEMQKKESDSLEEEISGMEKACTKVKDAYDALSKSLKLSEVDLIHAVMKEKQNAEENNDVEVIVKKRFTEVDFKFIISPHVTSFLKHFKVLGQVMLSEESANSKDNDNNSYEVSSVSSVPRSPTPPSSRHFNSGQANSEAWMSARERWARDRQLQSQRQAQNDVSYAAERGLQRQFAQQSPNRDGGFRNEERRAARMLPRPETPEVYTRAPVQNQRREFVARPMSTPPQENQLQIFSPTSRENQQFNYSNVYRHVKAEPISFSERNSPLPMTSSRIQNFQKEILPNSPAHFFARPTPAERPMSPEDDRPPSRAKSPPGQVSPRSPAPVLTVKEENGSFGRSFAAVQISNRRVYGNSEEDSRNPTRPRIMPTSPSSRSPVEAVSSQDVRYTGGMTYDRRPVIRSGTNELTVQLTDGHATDEEKVRRWVHKSSFASNGIKSKRLISGIGVLQDGRLIVVDQEHYTVQLFNQSYQFLNELKIDSRPFDVVVISDNKVVVSLQSERVLKFILVTNDSLTEVADLCVPCDMVCYGLCRGGGNYCVCCGDEVWILSDEGRVVNRLKNDVAGNPLFTQAEYVTTDRSCNVLFVSDAGSNKILALQVDGKRLWEFTYQGFKPCGLKLVDIYLYVCDRDQHRVLMLNLEGQVVNQSVIGRLENPRAICFSPGAETLFVTQMRYDAITSPARPVHVFTWQ